MSADGEDMAVVRVEVVDAKGRVCPTAGNEVKFAVEGAATICGVGNGDPSDHGRDKADRRKAFNGLGMALVQSSGAKGRIVLRATSLGLKEASLSPNTEGGVVSRKFLANPTRFSRRTNALPLRSDCPVFRHRRVVLIYA